MKLTDTVTFTLKTFLAFFQGETVDDDFPDWAKALCIILIIASVIFIPITALLIKYDLFKLNSPGSNDENELAGMPTSQSKTPLTN